MMLTRFLIVCVLLLPACSLSSPTGVGNSATTEQPRGAETIEALADTARTVDGRLSLALEQALTLPTPKREFAALQDTAACVSVSSVNSPTAVTISEDFSACTDAEGQIETSFSRDTTSNHLAIELVNLAQGNAAIENGTIEWLLFRQEAVITVLTDVDLRSKAPAASTEALFVVFDLAGRTVQVEGFAGRSTAISDDLLAFERLLFDFDLCTNGPVSGTLHHLHDGVTVSTHATAEGCDQLIIASSLANPATSADYQQLLEPLAAAYLALLNTLTGAQAKLVAVDDTPPETTISSGPPAVSKETEVVFVFATDGIATDCDRGDGTGWQPCQSPLTLTYGEGTYTLSVRGIDAAGNIDPSPATYEWTIDRTAPQAVWIDTPKVVDSKHGADFVLQNLESGLHFFCNLDGAGWTDCDATPSYSNLSVGRHEIVVRVADAAGNVSPDLDHTWRSGLVAHFGDGALAPPQRVDLDGDGDQEVVSSDARGTVFARGILDTNVDWTHQFVSGFSLPPVVGDFTGDGVTEVLSDSGSLFTAIAGTSGTALWNAAPSLAAGGQFAPVVTDLNRDGAMDFVPVNGGFSFVYSGTDGTQASGFGPFIDHYAVVAPIFGPAATGLVGASNAIVNVYTTADGVLQGSRNFNANSDPVYPVVGDLNGDGQLDVVVSHSESVDVATASTPGLPSLWSRDQGAGEPGFAALADLDGDGLPDVIQHYDDSAAPSLSGVLYAFSGTGGTVLWTAPTVGNVIAPVAADTNGDGVTDVVIVDVDATAPVMYLRALDGLTGVELSRYEIQHGLGPFLNTAFVDLHGPVSAYPNLGDADGDGMIDVVVVTGLGGGDGVFVVATDWSAPTHYAWPQVRRDNRHSSWYEAPW